MHSRWAQGGRARWRIDLGSLSQVEEATRAASAPLPNARCPFLIPPIAAGTAKSDDCLAGLLRQRWIRPEYPCQEQETLGITVFWKDEQLSADESPAILPMVVSRN
jgi:hypothetical protein